MSFSSSLLAEAVRRPPAIPFEELTRDQVDRMELANSRLANQLKVSASPGTH